MKTTEDKTALTSSPGKDGGKEVERDFPAEFEAWWETYRHKNREPADYSVKKQIAFDAFYFAARPQPASTALVERLEALDRGVRATSDTVYIASLNKFSSTPCLGWEAKVASGKFGKDEMEAHAEANKLMGKHQGLAEALKLIRSALSASTSREGER